MIEDLLCLLFDKQLHFWGLQYDWNTLKYVFEWKNFNSEVYIMNKVLDLYIWW
jgi:pterin-4a-carbinolamine dehydratase